MSAHSTRIVQNRVIGVVIIIVVSLAVLNVGLLSDYYRPPKFFKIRQTLFGTPTGPAHRLIILVLRYAAIGYTTAVMWRSEIQFSLCPRANEPQ